VSEGDRAHLVGVDVDDLDAIKAAGRQGEVSRNIGRRGAAFFLLDAAELRRADIDTVDLDLASGGEFDGRRATQLRGCDGLAAIVAVARAGKVVAVGAAEDAKLVLRIIRRHSVVKLSAASRLHCQR
jgi:hypothetical protein